LFQFFVSRLPPSTAGFLFGGEAARTSKQVAFSRRRARVFAADSQTPLICSWFPALTTAADFVFVAEKFFYFFPVRERLDF
jgi:hypothetical protein